MCGGVKYGRKKEYKCTLYLIIRNRAITSRHKSMVQGLFFDVQLLLPSMLKKMPLMPPLAEKLFRVARSGVRIISFTHAKPTVLFM